VLSLNGICIATKASWAEKIAERRFVGRDVCIGKGKIESSGLLQQDKVGRVASCENSDSLYI